MMRFSVEGQEFEISFRRYHPTLYLPDPNLKGTNKKTRTTHPSTEALILVVDPKKKPVEYDVHRSYTVGCYHQDKFTQEDGRLAALKMISKGNSLSKEFKAAMWEAYTNRFETFQIEVNPEIVVPVIDPLEAQE